MCIICVRVCVCARMCVCVLHIVNDRLNWCKQISLPLLLILHLLMERHPLPEVSEEKRCIWWALACTHTHVNKHTRDRLLPPRRDELIAHTHCTNYTETSAHEWVKIPASMRKNIVSSSFWLHAVKDSLTAEQVLCILLTQDHKLGFHLRFLSEKHSHTRMT